MENEISDVWCGLCLWHCCQHTTARLNRRNVIVHRFWGDRRVMINFSGSELFEWNGLNYTVLVRFSWFMQFRQWETETIEWDMEIWILFRTAEKLTRVFVARSTEPKYFPLNNVFYYMFPWNKILFHENNFMLCETVCLKTYH